MSDDLFPDSDETIDLYEKDSGFLPEEVTEASGNFDWRPAACLLGVFCLLVLGMLMGFGQARSVDSGPRIYPYPLSHQDLARLEPGAQVLREDQAIGRVLQVGIEDGQALAFLDKDPSTLLAEGEAFVVQSSSFLSGDYDLVVTDAKPPRSIEWPTQEDFSRLDVSTIAFAILGFTLLLGTAFLVKKVLTSYFFWILALVIAGAIVWATVEDGNVGHQLPGIENLKSHPSGE